MGGWVGGWVGVGWGLGVEISAVIICMVTLKQSKRFEIIHTVTILSFPMQLNFGTLGL